MKKLAIQLTFLLLVAALIVPFKTYAGFPIGKYRHILVPTFSYYHQKDRFDLNGNIVRGASGTGFTSYAFSLYYGYGITRRLDFIATLPFLFQQNTIGPGNTLRNQGLGDLTAGLSYNLINFGYLSYLSVGASGIVPLYSANNGTSPFGLGDFGTEVKLMYCGSLPKSLFDKGYFNTELAYRRFFNAQGPNQIGFTGTVGYPISRHDQLSADLLLFRSYSSNKAFNGNIYAARNYAYFKPQLNYGHTFTRRCSVFVGGFYIPVGLNTGVGYGGSLLAVLKI